MGLEKHVIFNACTVALSTLTGVGAVLVLTFISQSIEAYFIWQLAMAGIVSSTLRICLWRCLPDTTASAKFSIVELRLIWRFAAGMTGVSFATFCLMQLDKVVLSKILPLQDFALYMLAWSAASAVLLPAQVMGNVFFPKLSVAVASHNDAYIRKAFHRYNKLLVSATAPFGIVVCFFSADLLTLWLRVPETVALIQPSVWLLSIGSLCNGLLHIPYYLMLAKGETKYTIYQNVVSSLILAPLLLISVAHWGFLGGAISWLFVNACYVVISLPIINNMFIHSTLVDIYVKDIGVAVGISLTCAILSSCLFPTTGNWAALGLSVGTLITIYTTICLVNPEYRSLLLTLVIRYSRRLAHHPPH